VKCHRVCRDSTFLFTSWYCLGLWLT